MATEVIRSFLVALGFKTDEEALKKFTGGISKATKAVFTLATAIETVAVGVAAGVARFASNLEALYFASQRTGSSATQLKALDLAARSLGAHAGEAIEGVEGLASALRTNPGNIGLLQGLLAKLGLTLQFNADGSINAADALLKLTQVFKGMPFFQAAQFSEQLGISKDLLYQLTSGDLAGKYEKALKQLSEGGFNQATRDAHEFMDDLRDLEGQFEVFGVQVERALKEKLGFNLKDIREWLSVNGPWLADRIAEVAAAIIKAAQWIVEKIGIVIQTLKDWDTATDGLSTKLIALALILKVTGAGSLITGVIALASSLGLVSGTALAAAAAIGSVVTAANSLKNAMTGGDADNWISKWVDGFFPKSGNLGGWLYDKMHRGQSMYRYLRDKGWSANAVNGILANYEAESNGRSNASTSKAYGLAQWEAPRQLDFKRLFGHDMRESTDEEQMDFTDWELRHTRKDAGDRLRYAESPFNAGYVMSRYFEQPKGGIPEAERRGDMATRISQTTTIHVDGSGDPKAVADRVADQQRKVNADLTRNVAVAVVQ
jgi:hypothetical protein